MFFITTEATVASNDFRSRFQGSTDDVTCNLEEVDVVSSTETYS